MPRKKTPRGRKLHPRESLTEEELEEKVKKLYDVGYTFPEMAEELHKSITTIKEITDKIDASRKPKQKSKASEAYRLYKEDKGSLDVAIEVDIDAKEAEAYWEDFLRLKNLDELMRIYHEVGKELSIFLTFYSDFQAQGLTIDQIPILRKLNWQANQLSKEIILRTGEAKRLNDLMASLSSQISQLSSKRDNLKLEIMDKSTQKEQLSQQISNLNSILNSILHENISYQKIEQIAKNLGGSIISSRLEALTTALLAIILTLRKDARLVDLLLTPDPSLQDPALIKSFQELALEVWDELSSEVKRRAMTMLFEKLKQTVEELKNKDKPN
jgi:hypothetical protein